MGEKHHPGGNLMLTESMVETYLERLGGSDARNVCKENLFRLQAAHFERLPYTNLSFLKSGILNSLEPEALFERIIVQRKGGYCFELNGLFGELLRTLGYDVTEYFARWHFGGTDAIPMRRHRVLKVVLENEIYLADVGIGSLCPATPLTFKHDIVQPKNFRSYRIVTDPQLGNVVQAETPEGFLPYYSFTEDPHFPHDYIYVHAFCVQQPDSVFRNKLFVHKITEQKQWLIVNPTPEAPEFALRVWDNQTEELTPIKTKAEMQKILSDVFDLDYSADELPEITSKQ